MASFNIRPLERRDREWVAHFLDENWGSTQIVTRKKAVYGHLLPGLIAESIEGDTATPTGILIYNPEGGTWEIVVLDSLIRGQGVGTHLVEMFIAYARENHARRIWLVTTNDNLDALRFWQKRGFELAALHRDAIQETRRLKPQIPLIGAHGIPIRDEIELEYWL